VLYLPAEDPSIALRHRLWAAGSRLTPPIREQLYQSLEIVPLIGHVVDLLTPVWADALERMAEGRRLVVIDTLRRFHLGDENSGGDMVRLLGTLEGICSRTGATILFLHHTSKAAALNGGDQQQASRGSSVLVDNIRGGQWNLVGMTEGEAGTYGVDPVRRRSYVRLLHAKTNYGEPPLDTWLRRDEGGLLVRAELERVGDGGQRQDERPHGGRRRTHG
jgi:RecA-family ATPase